MAKLLTPPRISGRALRAAAGLARTHAGAALLYRALRADLGVDALDALPSHLRGDLPLHNRPLAGRPPRKGETSNDAPGSSSGWSPSSEAFTAAYASGRDTPSAVVARCLDHARALAARTPTVGPILAYADEDARRDAEASTTRWKEGRARSAIDGVPVVVKEQTAVRGLPRQSGTRFEDASPRAADATVVARLREAGAIVLGTTPMTEYGMSPLGQNAARAMPRNPHATGHVAGGSSTGSGVAVATGLVPFAIGADGGGSIRIPSAINGVFGIKPTWGRVSRAGDVSTGTVSHVGPLASSTLDLARFLEIAGGPDPADEETLAGPEIAPGTFTAARSRTVRGLRIGVCESEWADASPAVQNLGREGLRALEREGAVLVSIELALARHAAAIGYASIGVEARAALRDAWRNDADRMTPDLQVVLGSLGQVSAADFLDSQRLRAGLRREVATVLRDVDLLGLPATATTAPAVRDAEMLSGFSDARALDAMCRFMFLANLTGLPASSSPVGLDANGLPVGLQLVGDAWDEATVLAAMAALERSGAARVVRPRVSVEALAS